MSWRFLTAVAGTAALLLIPLGSERLAVRIGSKKFTESVILGELATLLAEDAGVPAQHAREMGGTRVLFEALAAGEIEAYPEYTGTITAEIFAGRELEGDAAVRAALAERGIAMSGRLGFNNGYGLGMLPAKAESLGVAAISDLLRHPDLRLGFSNEFLDRGDGWPALAGAYGLAQRDVRGMDHDVAYRQLAAGTIDVMEVYTTDADIEAFGLVVLEDDREHFSRYDAVLLMADDLRDRLPALHGALRRLEGTLDETSMMALNARARLERIPEPQVAADFLRNSLQVAIQPRQETRLDRIWRRTREHLALVRLSFLLAVLVGLPLGVLAAKVPRIGGALLGLVGIVQTIPSLALLVLLIGPAAALGLPSVGAGSAAAIGALFLYSLLPIVRNTAEGLRSVRPELLESARALGLPATVRLWRIELPLASRTILAGLKTAVIQNIGFATLGALIGAGGYGQPILTGIRLDDTGLILEGALPAAGLALLAQAAFAAIDLVYVPKGLRT